MVGVCWKFISSCMTFDLIWFLQINPESWLLDEKAESKIATLVAHFCSNVFSSSNVPCSVCHTGGVLVRASRRLGSKKLARKTSPAVLQVEVCWPPCNILTYIVYYLYITYMYHQYISPTVIYWSTYNVQCSVHNVHITYTYITSSSAGGPWQFLHYINLWNDILQGSLLIRAHLAIYNFNVGPEMIYCKVDSDRQTTLQNIVECEVKLCWIWICKMLSGNTSLQHQPGGNVRPQKIINLSLSKIKIKIQVSRVAMYGLKIEYIYLYLK